VATGNKQPMVQFKGILKRFGNVVAVEKMDFDIEEGSLVTLLGPPDAAKPPCCAWWPAWRSPPKAIFSSKGFKRINDTPIHKRNLGMIFQNYALFPHKTILTMWPSA
jgi:ABC-type Fe3+/spermidine/putrescine transport system ATPase subunit